VQSGGSTTVDGTLILGNAASISGSYTLSGTGVLTAAGETIGLSGSGAFTQSGGSNTVTSGTGGRSYRYRPEAMRRLIRTRLPKPGYLSEGPGRRRISQTVCCSSPRMRPAT